MEAALHDHLNGARVERVEARRLSDPGQTSEAIDIAVTFNGLSPAFSSRFE
jgi:hypothetical protein